MYLGSHAYASLHREYAKVGYSDHIDAGRLYAAVGDSLTRIAFRPVSHQ
jgi:hypothetical protein